PGADDAESSDTIEAPSARGSATMSLPRTGRQPVLATRGAVAAPHHVAAQAGLSMLQRGGSAIDAAIAANAVLAVVYPHMAGLGGDLFALGWDAGAGELFGL